MKAPQTAWRHTASFHAYTFRILLGNLSQSFLSRLTNSFTWILTKMTSKIGTLCFFPLSRFKAKKLLTQNHFPEYYKKIHAVKWVWGSSTSSWPFVRRHPHFSYGVFNAELKPILKISLAIMVFEIHVLIPLIRTARRSSSVTSGETLVNKLMTAVASASPISKAFWREVALFQS